MLGSRCGQFKAELCGQFRAEYTVIEHKSVTASELKKLDIAREYKDLDAAMDDEKSCIYKRLALLKDEALQQIEDKQYIDGFIQRHPDVKTVRCYGIAFCRRWVKIAMKE